jgi:cyclase
MYKKARKRIIPVLLIHQGGLVKSEKFKNYRYVGDPINAVKIFNDKEVDEIVILDIEASKKGIEPNYDTIAEITGEAFMPLAYGGGINRIDQAEKLFYNGVEKLVLNTVLHQASGFDLIKSIASQYGAQSVIGSIDVAYNLFGKPMVYSHAGKKVKESNPLSFAKMLVDAGVGEIFLNVVNRDGTYQGYDLSLLNKIAHEISIPLIICGGAADKTDFVRAEENGASAMAAGSMFVFKRPHNAVLISYEIEPA